MNKTRWKKPNVKEAPIVKLRDALVPLRDALREEAAKGRREIEELEKQMKERTSG